MSFIEKELKELKERIKDVSFTELITCHPSMVQIKVRFVKNTLIQTSFQLLPCSTLSLFVMTQAYREQTADNMCTIPRGLSKQNTSP